MAKMFEKPPDEKVATTSGLMPVVAPTCRKMSAKAKEERGMPLRTDVKKGHPEGNVGMKVVQVWDWEPETPPSPEEKKIETPRAPSCM